jgi:hypothetical protein
MFLKFLLNSVDLNIVRIRLIVFLNAMKIIGLFQMLNDNFIYKISNTVV